jgi:hypothetical protein
VIENKGGNTLTEETGGFHVYWSVLMERTISEMAANSLLNLAMSAGAKGFTRIGVPYMRVDWARSLVARAFLDRTKDPNDLLITLDCDHKHPQDVLLKLAAHPPECGVVGALSFRRGPPYEAMFFIRDSEGRLRSPAEWEDGLYEVDAVGMGAIAIRRWVFDALDANGWTWPYYQFAYPPECGFNKSEDIVFCEQVRAAGVQIYCNTSLCTPHIGTYLIDDKLWREVNVHNVRTADYDVAVEGKPKYAVPQLITNVEEAKSNGKKRKRKRKKAKVRA